jgi:hypothetical protein
MQCKTDEGLSHNQEQTDVIAKSEKPDRDFMDAERLCSRCHGPVSFCNGECSSENRSA